MKKYKIVFDVETDGDFWFEGLDIEVEYADNYEIAFNRLEERFIILRDTIQSSRDHVKKDVLMHVNEIIKALEDNRDFCLEEEHGINTNFDLGNQYGDFSIEVVEVDCSKEGIQSIISLD